MSDSNHSFIHDIRIATPCKANWEDMTGDERARFCQMCKLNVYNISEMTITEAEELIIGKEGRVCVRLFRRQDGTVITRDCPVGIAALRRKLATIYGSVAAVLSFAVFWVLNMGKPQTGCTSQGPVMGGVSATRAMMGEMAIPSPAPAPARMGKISVSSHVGRAVMGDIAPSPAPNNVSAVQMAVPPADAHDHK